jgi:protease-4
MKAFLRTVLAVWVALFLLILLVVMIGFAMGAGDAEIQNESWLVLDLEGEIVDYPLGGFESHFFGEMPSHTRLMENLEKAAADDRIEGVILRIGPSTLGPAKCEELRGAVEKVQETGKRVHAYCDMLFNRQYYLASVCDSVFMLPSGYFEMTGWASVRPFYKGTLDKLGIEPNVHRIEDYKSAAELVTRSEMSPESREMATWLMDDLYEDFVSTVTADRRMSRADFEGVMEKALLTPEEAVDAGLVDRTLYWDELEDGLKRPDEDKLRTVYGGTYGKVERSEVGIQGKKIAIVHAQGMIHGGRSGVDPMFGMMMGAQSVIADLRAAMDDDEIEGVIFRVDSPGGMGYASDKIGRWVKMVETKKPVVVSMADVAASGGYMVSHRMRPIVVSGNTITGSIGSITGKFNMRGLYDKLGISYDFVTRGPFALIHGEYDNWTPEEAEMVAENHWKGYNDWVEDIAEHRGLTFDQVDSVARGRVWTGRQALERNLVDKLGGLDKAIAELKRKAEIPADADVTIVHYPEKKSLIEAIMEGDLTTLVKSSVAMRVRGYLQEWAWSAQAGWCVMPFRVQ